jgi:SAM-dependent methyltransferase
MALPFHALKRLEPYMRGKSILSLGYPDLMATKEEIEKLFGYKPSKFTDAHEWHNTKDPMPETMEMFDHIGASVTIVDFNADRGIEKIADLNHPQELGKFDLVIDPGTLEHCFNIGQAFMNAANAVKVGGVICHLSPMTILNHGFYNLNPTLFNDFYLQNGWDVKELKIMPSSMPRLHTVKRFDMHTEYLMRVLVERTNGASLRFPVQTKYLEKMAAKNEVHLPGK